MKSKQEGNGAHQQAGAQHCTAPDDASHFIFLLQVKEMCQNKLGGSRGLSKSHQSLCCLFCFCARQQCQLPLEFLRLRELLCLAALPKDAAYSSCSCKPFKSASHFALAPILTPQRDNPHIQLMPRYTLLPAPSCPSQGEALPSSLQHSSFSVTLSIVSDVFAVRTRHFKAIEALWISKQNTLTHDYVQAQQHTMKSGNLLIVSSSVI